MKDASATAVFGVRGANGVILVTTRRGEKGKAKISVSSNVSIQMPTRLLENCDSYHTALLYNENWITTTHRLPVLAIMRWRLTEQVPIL